MHERTEKAYREQKEFIENASHELQTPLAIVRGKLELLADHDNLNEEELKEIDDMYRSLNRAVQLNKSLLLLSRIQNGQFTQTTEVAMAPHVRQIVEMLSDIYEDKKLSFGIREEGGCTARMDESLAHTLLTNLIKNAIVHSPDGSHVEVRVGSREVEISNDGPSALDPRQIFRRFHKGDTLHKESTGLGLSIAQSIASLYNIGIDYRYDGRHHFTLKFPK